MKRFICATALVAAAVFPTIPAGATPFTVNYQLNGVTFLDGGTASGYFTASFDPTLMGNGFYQLLAVDILTTPGSVLSGAHYNDLFNWQSSVQGPVKQIGTAGPYFSAMVLGFVTTDLSSSLIFNFDQAIPVTPTTTLQLIATDPYPGERTNNTWRTLGLGSLVPVAEVTAPVTEVPEPPTLMIVVTGLGLMAWALARRSPSI